MYSPLIIAISTFFLLLAIYGYFTNPFVRFTIIIDPFKYYSLTAKTIIRSHRLIVRWRRIFKFVAMIKAGWHIVFNSFLRRQKAHGKELHSIIEQIHLVRFNPKLPFLISGDHFSVLYPRSLGIFYYSSLDPRIPSNNENWLNRQLLYTKTVLYALSVYEQTETLSTTIVPITRRSVALMNIYAYPSDTLYSLLSAIENVSDSKHFEKLYPYKVPYTHFLSTKTAANNILTEFSSTLKRHWLRYKHDVLDPSTKLIKAHWRLSGTKDIAKRSSAFYDNVIYWRTWQLAQKFQLADADEVGLVALKQHILQDYWDEEQQQFYEDKSQEGRKKHYSSSDWLIAYQTGFLSPNDKNDLLYITKAIKSIIDSELDQPFGLRYHQDIRPSQLYWPVRLGAPLYGSQVIWSHWGMEYSKLLAHLAQVTKDTAFLERAKQQLAKYEENIIHTKGYPEVYAPSGKPYRHWLYASVHQTGWVINFEQTQAMILYTEEMLKHT